MRNLTWSSSRTNPEAFKRPFDVVDTPERSNVHQVVAPAPAAGNAGSASQKEFEKLFEAYAAKNPANGQPNPNCRMKVM